MATDIHAFVEYRIKNEKKTSWHSFSSDTLLLERDYTMFYILAEARGKAPNSFVAKGKIPIDELSVWVRDNRMEMIGEYNEEIGDTIGDCTIENAIKYKKEFDCRIHYVENNPVWVDSPDFHTDTWLSFSEYEKALGYYKDYTKKVPFCGYLAVYEVMKVYKDAGYETRLVIYFDN